MPDINPTHNDRVYKCVKIKWETPLTFLGYTNSDQNFWCRTSLPGYKQGRQLTTNANV